MNDSAKQTGQRFSVLMLIGGEILLQRNSNVEKDATADYFGECMQPRGADRRYLAPPCARMPLGRVH